MPSGEHLCASQVSLCLTINSSSDSWGLICLNIVLFPSLDCNFQVHECLKQTQSQMHSNVTRGREAISQPPLSQRSCCSLQDPRSHLLGPAGHPQACCHPKVLRSGGGGRRWQSSPSLTPGAPEVPYAWIKRQPNAPVNLLGICRLD